VSKVLVVDDDEALLRALRIGLTARGYEVSLARTGAEGVKQVSLSFGNLGALRCLQCAGPVLRLPVGGVHGKR